MTLGRVHVTAPKTISLQVAARVLLEFGLNASYSEPLICTAEPRSMPRLFTPQTENRRHFDGGIARSLKLQALRQCFPYDSAIATSIINRIRLT